MTRSYVAPSAAAAGLSGAVGGAIGGVAALGVLAFGARARDLPAVAGPNAVGATFARWLQYAAPDAVRHAYPDATIGGAALVILAGALAGALFVMALPRVSEGAPLPWGIVAGLAGAVVVRWVLAPALDPLLVRLLGGRTLGAAGLAWGLVVGAWTAAGRRVAGDLVDRVDGP